MHCRNRVCGPSSAARERLCHVQHGVQHAGPARLRQPQFARGLYCVAVGILKGENPSSGVIEDASGNIFGMAGGGDCGGDGVVYEFGSGREQVLYTFCSQANCTDGAGPSGGLIMDAAGNLYGTTQGGAAFNAGTVFELEY